MGEVYGARDTRLQRDVPDRPPRLRRSIPSRLPRSPTQPARRPGRADRSVRSRPSRVRNGGRHRLRRRSPRLPASSCGRRFPAIRYGIGLLGETVARRREPRLWSLLIASFHDSLVSEHDHCRAARPARRKLSERFFLWKHSVIPTEFKLDDAHLLPEEADVPHVGQDLDAAALPCQL